MTIRNNSKQTTNKPQTNNKQEEEGQQQQQQQQQPLKNNTRKSNLLHELDWWRGQRLGRSLQGSEPTVNKMEITTANKQSQQQTTTSFPY